MKISLMEDFAPVLYIEPEVWVKMRALCTEIPPEVAALGLVEKLSSREFLLKELMIPKQQVSSASVAIDPDSVLEWVNARGIDLLSELRFYLHTHPGFSSPSAFDESEYDLFKDAPYFFWAVGTKSEIRFGMLWKEMGLKIEGIRTSLWVPIDCDKWIEEEVKPKVERTTVSTTYGNYGNYYYPTYYSATYPYYHNIKQQDGADDGFSETGGFSRSK